MPKLSIVVPVFNEEQGLRPFFCRLLAAATGLGVDYEIVFVDDGSRDQTFAVILELASQYPAVRGLRLSRNFGHQPALFAGIESARGEWVLMLDGDGQHPPELLPELWEHAQNGVEVVYTVRVDSEDTGRFKAVTAAYFYRLFSMFSDVPLKPNCADFRLVSRRVCQAIVSLKERDLFLRGLFAWVGYSSREVSYQAEKRQFGQSAYTVRRMVRFAVSGLTSFSVAPIRIAYLSMAIMALLIAGSYSAYALYVKYILKEATQGWTSLLILISVYFSGVFLVLGVIGEYLAKIFLEVKQRPHYFVAQTAGDHDGN